MLGNCSTVSKLFSAVVKLFLRVCSCASQLAGSPSAVLTGPRFARNCATCASNSRVGPLTKSRHLHTSNPEISMQEKRFLQACRIDATNIRIHTLDVPAENRDVPIECWDIPIA